MNYLGHIYGTSAFMCGTSALMTSGANLLIRCNDESESKTLRLVEGTSTKQGLEHLASVKL